MQKGLVKVRNFTSSRNKAAYAYILTPQGLEEKVNVTYEFLRRKVAEYDLLKQEIDQLTAEVNALDAESKSAVQ
jgi:EPS-associated MarR family transcriptional regulator